MGEKIRDIGKLEIGSSRFAIELNEGYDKRYSKYDIHIQNDDIQYSLTNAEFVKLAAAFINANEKLKALKK